MDSLLLVAEERTVSDRGSREPGVDLLAEEFSEHLGDRSGSPIDRSRLEVRPTHEFPVVERLLEGLRSGSRK
jgi:hypothetical protein